MLFELVARPLVIAHALLGGTLVALTTHHLIWIVRSRGSRRRGEPRFALLASGAFFLTFLFGCVVYPTYRVRVRAEYFDAASAQDAERALQKSYATAPGPALQPVTLQRAARIFDVKEHLVALGLIASAALFWLSRRADPSDPDDRPLYVGLAAFVCATSWSGVLVGLYTASLRSVGAS